MQQHRGDNVSSSDVFLLFDDTEDWEKKDVAKNIINTHVREQVLNDTFDYSVQNGIMYKFDKRELVDDFANSVDLVELYPEENEFGTVRIDLIASTIDTARLTEIPNEPPFETAPQWENTTWVKCSLKAYCRFSIDGIQTEVAISISQHPIEKPDEESG